MVKRFMVFGYMLHYPKGGLDDVQASFDSLEEALIHAITELDYMNRVQVFDRENGTTHPVKWTKYPY